MRGFHWLKRGVREYRGTLLFLTLMLAFRSSYADWLMVPTGSMNPTIIEGDRIFTNKHAYGWRIPFTHVRLTQGADPQRGEIAVFDSPKDGTRLVKRVIGIPGDTIEMRDEVLYLNGRRLSYSARGLARHPASNEKLQPEFITEHLGETTHAVMLLPQVIAHRDFGPITIPQINISCWAITAITVRTHATLGSHRASYSSDARIMCCCLLIERFYLPRLERAWKPII
jgi:signal peptidase I